MKIIAAVLLIVLTISCSKESFKGNTGLIGKWKLKEQTSGLGINGGTWIPAPSNYVKQLQFFSNGTFEEYETSRQVPRTCNGTYQLAGDSLLIMNNACEASVDSMVVLTISKMQLQLMYPNGFSRGERYDAVQ